MDKSTDSYIIIFADDTSLYLVAKSIDMLKQNIILNKNKLKLNKEKNKI